MTLATNAAQLVEMAVAGVVAQGDSPAPAMVRASRWS